MRVLTEKQEAALTFLRPRGYSSLIGDIGSGKTAVAMHVMLHHLKAGSVKRWLILAPGLVAEEVWPREAALWPSLKNFPAVSVATGSAKQRAEIFVGNGKVVATNFEGVDKIPAGAFDGLVVDEVDKLKDPRSARFKYFRHYLQQFSVRLTMTGTPSPNELKEIWGQALVADNGTALGLSYDKFLEKYFWPIKREHDRWGELAGSREKILKLLESHTYRLRAEPLPSVTLLPPDVLPMSPALKLHYAQMQRRNNPVSVFSDGQKVMAKNAAVRTEKLRQLCSGFMYMTPAGKATKLRPETRWIDDSKLRWAEKLIRSLQPAQVLIATQFAAETEWIRANLPDVLVIDGRTSKKMRGEILEKWNTGKLKALALHPATAGHGLNLQLSGANHIAFLSSPYSGGLFKQVIGRLRRTGQRANIIYIHVPVFSGTIDEHIQRQLVEKARNEQIILDTFEEQTLAREKK